jgi:serine/threonine protein kinase
MSSASARTLSSAEMELTLSGVLSLSAADQSSHIPLGSALQLSLEVVRMVAKAHDCGEVVGVLDAGHLICGKNGGLTFDTTGGNPIAPELKRGDMPDRLTDVYALGALMYRLLTGRRVNPSKSVIEPPSHFNPAVDSALDELVLQSLDEDPSERPYSARDLERKLVAVFDDLGLEAESMAEAHTLITKSVSLKRPSMGRVMVPVKSVSVSRSASRPAPKPVSKPVPPTVPWEVEPATVMEDDDDWQPQAASASSLDKKWLIIAGASIAALIFMFIAWPSSGKKHTSSKDSAPVAAKSAPTPPPAPAPKVEARLVDSVPASSPIAGAPEPQSQTKVSKVIVKSSSTVKTTVRKSSRRGRR